MKKIGIISDTHGKLTETQWAVQIFKEQDVAVIIHCGDIGDSAVVHAFREIETHFVHGNCDYETTMLRNAAEDDGNHFHGEFGSLEIEGKRISFLHGHQTLRFNKEIESQHWNLICYGHTHRTAFECCGETFLLNPGAFERVAAPTVAVLTLPEMNIERFSI
jgi:putative phosphoesterase